MAKVVEVLDSIMGSGKTTKIMQWMLDNPHQKYLYVTPLLSESTNRVVPTLEPLGFVTPLGPEDHPQGESKGKQLAEMLRLGKNVAFSHALFRKMTQEHLAYIRLRKYTLIIDEQIELIAPFSSQSYNSFDFRWAHKEGFIEIAPEDGKVTWLNKSTPYEGTLGELRSMCETGMLFCTKRDPGMVTVQLPMQLITDARRVILLTYLFKGNIMHRFLQFRKVPVVPFTEFILNQGSRAEWKNLITFVGKRQCKVFDEMAEEEGVKLTSSGYDSKKMTQARLKTLERAIKAIGKTQGATADDLAYCVPKRFINVTDKRSKKLKPQSYAAGTGEIDPVTEKAKGCFLSCTAIATNAYRHKRVMIHAYDRHPHQVVKAYLEDYGFPPDANIFALSEMLQWLFRSRIRDGKPIEACIIPKRMRKLLEAWLDEEDSLPGECLNVRPIESLQAEMVLIPNLPSTPHTHSLA